MLEHEFQDHQLVHAQLREHSQAQVAFLIYPVHCKSGQNLPDKYEGTKKKCTSVCVGVYIYIYMKASEVKKVQNTTLLPATGRSRAGQRNSEIKSKF